MFGQIYLPAIAVAMRDGPSGAVDKMVLSGRFSEAVRSLGRDDLNLASPENEGAMQLHADLLTALCYYEDAEDLYKRHLKYLGTTRRDALRIASFRNNGWKSLFRSRMRTARSSFLQVLEVESASYAERSESLIGCALVQNYIGNVAGADRTLQLAEQTATVGDTKSLRRIATLLRIDLAVQQHGRNLRRGLDHVFWTIPSQTVLHGPAARDEMRAQLNSVVQRVDDMPVLLQRCRFLGALLDLSEARGDATNIIHSHLDWALSMGLGDYHNSTRLDAVFVFQAVGRHAAANTLLSACKQRFTPRHTDARWAVDYLYCAALALYQQGDIEAAFGVYLDYAAMAIDLARSDSRVENTDTSNLPDSPSAFDELADEISTCLPGKYRRAYQYLMNHLDQSDLSVGEIAQEIGVTERALQIAFKHNLGLSPSEVMRARRLDRIRHDISHGAADRPVLDTAAKWGIRSRSTLTSSYKKRFKETPSETVRRATE